jgi:integrase
MKDEQVRNVTARKEEAFCSGDIAVDGCALAVHTEFNSSSTALPPSCGLQLPADGLVPSEILRPAVKAAKVSMVAVPGQRDRRTMSRRRGQRGSTRVVGEKYIGRYWADVPGSTKRVRKAVEIGSIHEMTRSEAKRWLANCIEEQGINSSAHLSRSQSPVVSFGDAAQLWWQRQLIACGKPSSQSSMGCELRKHVVPLLKDVPLEEVNDYSLIRDLIATWQEEDREDGEVGYSYKSMENFFRHIRAAYNFYRDETAQKGKPRIGEWFVKWKRVAPPKPIEEEQPHSSSLVTSAIVNKAKTQMERALYATGYGVAGRSGEVFGLHVEDVQEQANGTGIVCIRRSVFAGLEYNTKSNKTRYVPIDASVMEEIKKHLAGRASGYVFQTRNKTPLRLSNVLEDSLHPILDELGVPRTGMHAFRRGRISDWVYSNVTRQVIRDWAGHGSDKLVDLYTKKMWEYHSPEMAKVKPLLDSNWTQAAEEESGTTKQPVVN